MSTTKLTLTEAEVEANAIAFSYLTPREGQIAKLIACGRDRTAVGKALDISSKTVDVFLGKIRKKLECAGTGEIPLVVFSALGVALPFELEV